MCLSCSGRIGFYGRRASYDYWSELRDREAIYILFAFRIAHVVSGKWPAAGPKTPLLHARFCSAPCLTFNYNIAESNLKNRTPLPLALGGESNRRKSSDWLRRVAHSELYKVLTNRQLGTKSHIVLLKKLRDAGLLHRHLEQLGLRASLNYKTPQILFPMHWPYSMA